MKILLHAGALALAALLCAPVMAQETIAAPAGFVPKQAMTYAGADGKAVTVSPTNPLPISGGSAGVTCTVVAAGDTTWTTGSPYALPCTTTGRLRVGLSSAAQEGGALASYTDLMGAQGADGLQHAPRLDSNLNLRTADSTLATKIDTLNGKLDQLHTDMIAATPAGTNNIGTVVTVGNAVAGTADTGASIKIGGKASASAPTNVVAGQRVDQWFNLNGSANFVMRFGSGGALLEDYASADGRSPSANSLAGTTSYGFNFNGATMDRTRGDTNGTVNQPFAMASSRWAYPAPAGGLSTASAVTIMSAGGTGVRNYLTAIKLSYGSLTTATEIVVRDGAGGTVLYRDWLPTGSAGRASLSFDNPLRGTANTLMEVALLAASAPGAAVYINASGFQGN